MPRYFAQIADGLVTRVIVANSKEWCESRLGGTWIETRDPYAETQPDPSLEPVVYCGPGYGADPTFPERFAPQWVPPYVDPETGQWVMPQKGDIRARHGRLWKSTVNNNAWEPGVSAWHDEPEIEGVLPRYVPVTGAHDTYPLGFELLHNDIRYINDRDNNDREPGTFDSGWRVFGEEPPVGEQWIDTGATVTSQAGQLYYVSAPIATLGLVAGQAIRLGDAETTYAATWSGTDNLMQINPYVAAATGAKVWKWA